MAVELTVQFDVPARMRDGVTLYANIIRPADGGPYPVALSRTPYCKDLSTSFLYMDAVRLAQAGYIVVVQDVRGRYKSEGEWQLFVHEAEDGYDSVEWAAGLPGSSGSVGMFGISYLGFAQWAAASLKPPHLKAIMPAVTVADANDGMFWRGGALELGILAHLLVPSIGFDVLVRRLAGSPQLGPALAAFTAEVDDLAPGRGGYDWLPLETFGPITRLDLGKELLAELIAHPAGEHFRGMPYSILDLYEQVDVPVCNIGAWYDIFQAGTLQNFQSIRRQGGTPQARRHSQLVVGPWSHINYSNVVGDVDFGSAGMMAMMFGQLDMVGLTARWFDHWLKGVDNGVADEPPVRYFLMGANAWREASDWPPPAARPQAFYLQAGGGLSQQPPQGAPAPAEYVYDPACPAPTYGGSILMNPAYGPGARDQRRLEERADVLSFTSPVLEQPLEVTGPVKARLWAASSAPDTDFVARLVDVHPDGFAQVLCDGILRASWREGGPSPALQPGQPACFEIDLWSTANLFQAGHRIRLDVTSSSFPRWDRNPNTGAAFGRSTQLAPARQAIYFDAGHPSCVVLPVI